MIVDKIRLAFVCFTDDLLPKFGDRSQSNLSSMCTSRDAFWYVWLEDSRQPLPDRVMSELPVNWA